MDAALTNARAPDMPDRLLAAAAFAYVGLAGVTGLVLAIACLLCASTLRTGVLARGLLAFFGLDS